MPTDPALDALQAKLDNTNNRLAAIQDTLRLNNDLLQPFKDKKEQAETDYREALRVMAEYYTVNTSNNKAEKNKQRVMAKNMQRLVTKRKQQLEQASDALNDAETTYQSQRIALLKERTELTAHVIELDDAKKRGQSPFTLPNIFRVLSRDDELNTIQINADEEYTTTESTDASNQETTASGRQSREASISTDTASELISSPPVLSNQETIIADINTTLSEYESRLVDAETALNNCFSHQAELDNQYEYLTKNHKKYNTEISIAIQKLISEDIETINTIQNQIATRGPLGRFFDRLYRLIFNQSRLEYALKQTLENKQNLIKALLKDTGVSGEWYTEYGHNPKEYETALRSIDMQLNALDEQIEAHTIDVNSLYTEITTREQQRQQLMHWTEQRDTLIERLKSPASKTNSSKTDSSKESQFSLFNGLYSQENEDIATVKTQLIHFLNKPTEANLTHLTESMRTNLNWLADKTLKGVISEVNGLYPAIELPRIDEQQLLNEARGVLPDNEKITALLAEQYELHAQKTFYMRHQMQSIQDEIKTLQNTCDTLVDLIQQEETQLAERIKLIHINECALLNAHRALNYAERYSNSVNSDQMNEGQSEQEVAEHQKEQQAIQSIIYEIKHQIHLIKQTLPIEIYNELETLIANQLKTDTLLSDFYTTDLVGDNQLITQLNQVYKAYATAANPVPEVITPESIAAFKHQLNPQQEHALNEQVEALMIRRFKLIETSILQALNAEHSEADDLYNQASDAIDAVSHALDSNDAEASSFHAAVNQLNAALNLSGENDRLIQQAFTEFKQSIPSFPEPIQAQCTAIQASIDACLNYTTFKPVLTWIQDSTLNQFNTDKQRWVKHTEQLTETTERIRQLEASLTALNNEMRALRKAREQWLSSPAAQLALATQQLITACTELETTHSAVKNALLVYLEHPDTPRCLALNMAIKEAITPTLLRSSLHSDEALNTLLIQTGIFYPEINKLTALHKITTKIEQPANFKDKFLTVMNRFNPNTPQNTKPSP